MAEQTPAEAEMLRLQNYLNRNNIPWRPTEEWSFIFQGNHPEGIFIESSIAPLPYLKILKNLSWEYRGHYTSIYVYTKPEVQNGGIKKCIIQFD